MSATKKMWSERIGQIPNVIRSCIITILKIVCLPITLIRDGYMWCYDMNRELVSFLTIATSTLALVVGLWTGLTYLDDNTEASDYMFDRMSKCEKAMALTHIEKSGVVLNKDVDTFKSACGGGDSANRQREYILKEKS